MTAAALLPGGKPLCACCVDTVVLWTVTADGSLPLMPAWRELEGGGGWAAGGAGLGGGAAKHVQSVEWSITCVLGIAHMHTSCSCSSEFAGVKDLAWTAGWSTRKQAAKSAWGCCRMPLVSAASSNG